MNFLQLLAAIDADIPKVSMTKLVANGLNIIYFIAGMVAVAIIIMSGFQFMTSNGDTAKNSKALRSIIYCVIGLAVVIFAFAITNFITGRV